ncbi:hypothetical protein PO124_06325 [Bacillus licheniformis]|nr:hypothetical protein [Bacillus licheniformis]
MIFSLTVSSDSATILNHIHIKREGTYTFGQRDVHSPAWRRQSSQKAETVIKTENHGCFNQEWLETDIAITDGAIVGLGEYEGEISLTLRDK